MNKIGLWSDGSSGIDKGRSGMLRFLKKIMSMVVGVDPFAG